MLIFSKLVPYYFLITSCFSVSSFLIVHSSFLAEAHWKSGFQPFWFYLPTISFINRLSPQLFCTLYTDICIKVLLVLKRNKTAVEKCQEIWEQYRWSICSELFSDIQYWQVSFQSLTLLFLIYIWRRTHMKWTPARFELCLFVGNFQTWKSWFFRNYSFEL